jgi:Na+-driven multidrug efflux pump
LFVADVFNFLAIATANQLALAFAARAKAQTEQVMNEALMAATVVGIASGAAYFFFAPQLIALMAGEGGAALVAPASQYVQIRALGLIAALIASVLQVRPVPLFVSRWSETTMTDAVLCFNYW